MMIMMMMMHTLSHPQGVVRPPPAAPLWEPRMDDSCTLGATPRGLSDHLLRHPSGSPEWTTVAHFVQNAAHDDEADDDADDMMMI